MNAQQRAKHLSKVHSLATTIQPGDSCEDKKELSIDMNIVLKQVNLPLTCIEGIWRKAIELINNPNAMSHAPGQSPESRMVLSYSGKNPHLVTATKGGSYNCDSHCPNWKSLGLCVHTVAVAEVNKNCLNSCFLFKKRKGHQTFLASLHPKCQVVVVAKETLLHVLGKKWKSQTQGCQ